MTAQARSLPIVIQNADQAGKLEGVARSGACEAGGVVVLDFVAVLAATGDRWTLRRDDVHRRIEREIQRRLSCSAVFLRVGECEYLVSFIDAQGPAAQARAFNIMEELLTHFLGRCEPQHLIVKAVSAIGAGGVEARPLARAEVERQSAGRERALAEAAPKPPPAFTLIEGEVERLGLRLAPQDVVHIASGLNIGARMSISLYRTDGEGLLSHREECCLSPASLLQITQRTTESLRALMADRQRPSVFVLPLFLQTLTTSRSRSVVLEELGRFCAFDQRRLVVELTGVERGTPSARLMETSWRLRPFCRAVTGRAQLERSALNAVTGARLAGVHLSARDLGSNASQRAAGLLAAGQAARNLAPMVMAVDLPGPEALKLCAAAGFSHAALPPRES